MRDTKISKIYDYSINRQKKNRTCQRMTRSSTFMFYNPRNLDYPQREAPQEVQIRQPS